MAVFFSGFFLSFSLIMAIGAQNAFVLRQGLRREHVLLCVLICGVSDALLIALGVTSFGVLSAQMPWLGPIMRYGGASFLLVYGVMAFRSALTSTEALNVEGRARSDWRKVAATLLALTWLNPHVYLDTVILLGSIAAQYGEQRVVFGAGAIFASITFFFLLGFGARLLAPFFAWPKAWRILDALVGATMWAIAVSLILNG
ncbi:LysE/ArgO family amino acid transporter [Litoreibacter janthinus]|uniref:L-lysine exporter family protein LysE/ArgO n=1 Tax=Litoreibacter janthinus TaxID=670154 RepID=A0A1I6GMR8_9RHOB|nr:LysE/ArgO family amino acid transporter [Litoreibacter janthinus]SFR43426.1 L-lysine exporter family protein LysE/ArgO [Litoreibacter janthinus]